MTDWTEDDERIAKYLYPDERVFWEKRIDQSGAVSRYLSIESPNGNIRGAPHWNGSADAALTLPFDGLKDGWYDGNSLVIILDTAVQVRYTMTAAITMTTPPPAIAYGGDTDFEKPYSERLAVAICRAWLAWKEAHK